MEARVTAYSQSNRLRERMEEAEVRYGQEVRADVLTTLKAMTGQDFKDTASAKAWAESNRTAGWDW